jgi:hypothetical protein
MVVADNTDRVRPNNNPGDILGSIDTTRVLRNSYIRFSCQFISVRSLYAFTEKPSSFSVELWKKRACVSRLSASEEDFQMR